MLPRKGSGAVVINQGLGEVIMFKKFAGALVAVSAVVSSAAHAALPAGVSDGFTAISTDATTLAGYAGAAVILVLGFTIGLKLTKRFANKI